MFCAKNGTKINPIIANSDPIIVSRYPYRSATTPLTSNPIISPTRAPFESPLCHGAVTWNLPGSYSTPNLLLKGGNAKNEDMSAVSVLNKQMAGRFSGCSVLITVSFHDHSE
jgi:hypothetical protein